MSLTTADLEAITNIVEITVARQIDDLRTDIAKGFNEIDERFREVDRRFQKINRRFEEIEKRLDAIELRLDKIEVRLLAVETKQNIHTDHIRQLNMLTKSA